MKLSCAKHNAREPRTSIIKAVDRRKMLFASAMALATFGPRTPARADNANIETEPIIQPLSADDTAFMERAFAMRQRAIDLGDQAYGAVIVRDMTIIGQSWSRVVLDRDPTAHAEMATIRDAARRTGNRNLSGTVMYASSRPCPMCEAAAYWAGINKMIHGRAMSDAGAPILCR